MRSKISRTLKKRKNRNIIIILAAVVLIPMMFVLVSFSPFDSIDSNTTYISATDIIKNFKFTTFDGEAIVNEGVYDNKLRFDTQAAWILYKDDVRLLHSQEIGDSTVLRYRLVVRNKINLYTNVKLSQMSTSIAKIYGKYLAVKYKHYTIGQKSAIQWERYVTWEHYDFGNIKMHNDRNNIFSGRLKMTFDIDTNPIPDTFGDNTETEYGYIAVSEAGIATSSWGQMTDAMPTIVVLSPSEDSKGTTKTDAFSGGAGGDNAMLQYTLEPNTKLTVWEDPAESFDGGIQPDTDGSSLNPTNKDGTDKWDPEKKEESMTGAELNYDLVKLSPIVYLWKGKLEYTDYDLAIEDVLGSWFAVVPTKKHYWSNDNIEFGDTMLHGINRYIQSDIYVAFDIWTSIKLGTLTEYYEQMRLEAPEEYYDTLIWATLAGGWAGGEIKEYSTPIALWLEELWESLFGFGGIFTIIIIIVIVAVGLYIFIKVGIPMIRMRQRKKERKMR